MMSFGGSEVAGNALRHSRALRASLALRRWVVRRSRMTATPPKYQLWHPTRGISFSPATRSPYLSPQDPEAWNKAAAATNQARGDASPPDGIEVASLYPKLEELSLSTPEQNAPISDEATSETTEATDENATIIIEKEEKSLEEVIPGDVPVSELSFKIVDDLFFAAKKAPPGSKDSYWSYAQYRGTAHDGSEQKVKVHYCRSRHTMERVCQEYFKDEKVLGFDLEWEADSTRWQGAKRNVSLIQLASPSRIGLFHVALFAEKSDLVGPNFKAIMEDPNITKVGVAIKGDATRVRNFLGVDSKGLLELSHLYRLVTYSATGQYQNINRKLVPLATQVEQYLHLPLFKGRDVRASNWSKPLNIEQIAYGASDAYAGLQLYATLEYHRKQLNPCPPTPYHAERNLRIRIAEGIELAANDDPVVDAIEETVLEVSAVAKSRSTASKPPPAPKDSRVEIAEDRVACYKSANPNLRASTPRLRAYYMWHDLGLDPQTIAQLLRDPPLKTDTVLGYILTAVQLEKLPVDAERMRQEITGTMRQSVLRARYPFVAAAIAVQS